jgi:hypothetical protein
MNMLKAVSRSAVVLAVIGVAYAGPVAFGAGPMADKEADPSIKERLMSDTVKGDVLRVDDNTLVVRDTDGKQVSLHIDHTTKMDKVMPGDKVKAYITEKGHVTTLERLKK